MVKRKAPPPSRLSRALSVELPPPAVSQARTVKLLLALSEEEAATIAKAAALRGEPRAAFIRTVAVTVSENMIAEAQKSKR